MIHRINYLLPFGGEVCFATLSVEKQQQPVCIHHRLCWGEKNQAKRHPRVSCCLCLPSREGDAIILTVVSLIQVKSLD